MKFKRHILMTSAVASLGIGLAMGVAAPGAYAQDATASGDSTTVIVTGIRKSLQDSLRQKRNSDRVEEVITAEDIGKFPDKNVADSLSRAAGVNVVTGSSAGGGFGENEHISIRGTDPNLNLTLLDGHNMATGDWFVLDQTAGGRAFNYTMLPSEVVGTIQVIKSSSADLPEGGMGGTVDVHVRKPLDLASNTAAFSVEALYSTRPDKTTPQLSGMYSWKNGAHNFGILVGAYYEQRDFRRDGQEILGYGAQDNFAGSGKTVMVPSLIGAAYFTQERTREGANFVTQWKPSDTLEFDFSGLYTHLSADNENHNFMMWGSKLQGVTPSAYTTTTNPADGLTYLTSADWTVAETAGTPTIVQDDIFRKAHSDSYSLNLDMNWQATDKLNVKGQVGYTAGEGDTDDSAAWETFWSGTGASFKLGNPTTTVSYPGLPTDPTSAAYLNNQYSWSWGGAVKSPDREAYAKIDAEYAINSGALRSIDFGARYTDHTRRLDDIAYSWGGNAAGGVNLATVYKGGITPSNYGSGLGGVLPTYTFASGDAVYNYEDTHNGGRVFGFYAPASFAVHEKTDAYYLMAKLGGDRWSGNIGVRAVHTNENSTQYSTNYPAGTPTTPSVFGAYAQFDTKHDYWDVLPSATLNYKATDDLTLRATASTVMTRPGFAQLAGAYYLDDANYTGTAGGNPDLDPYKANQYNLSAEWYFAPQSLFAVTLFDIDFSNYITSNTFTGFYYDVLNPAGHTFTLTGPANGGKAKDTGFEVSLQQPLPYGFGYILNYTASNGKAGKGGAIDGNSKTTYNATFYYENSLLSARLAYNYRSKFQSGIDRATPMWQDDYGTLDGSFNYNLTSHIALSIEAQNLGNSKLYYFVGSPNIPRAYYDYGRTFYAGFRFKY